MSARPNAAVANNIAEMHSQTRISKILIRREPLASETHPSGPHLRTVQIAVLLLSEKSGIEPEGPVAPTPGTGVFNQEFQFFDAREVHVVAGMF